MNTTILVTIGLRAAALAVGLSGQSKASDRLYALADTIEAGRATEEHMKLVAELLKSRSLTPEDWDDLDRRLKADQDRLHSP